MRRSECKEYHEWEVAEVNGTLPHQEIEIVCKNCGINHYLEFEVRD